MRLEVSRKADLATRALLDLARSPDRSKSSDLAARLGTSPGYLTQVLAPLTTLGWIQSAPGPAGGYRTTVSLDDVSVLEVIEAVEGPTDTGRCVLTDGACAGTGPCALHEAWTSARDQLLGELSSTPLSALPGLPMEPAT